MQIDEAYAKLNIVVDLLPAGNSNRPGPTLAPSSITIHNTDNASPGANAAAHARYMKGPDAQKRQVSWHFSVDDKWVYQSLPTNEIGWHAGTKAGNRSSIGIEICMNPELDVPATYDRAALLVAVMAYKHGLRIPDGLFQHHDWSGKDCPTILRHTTHGMGWSDFVKAAQTYLKGLTPTPSVELTPIDDKAPTDDHHHA